MHPTVQSFLESLQLGPLRQSDGLTIVAVVGPSSATVSYASLSDALDTGGLQVDEVSASGSVPELAVVNQHTLPVLLVDGEELVGAKQNRLVNASVLVPTGERIVLDVTCSELGRWHRITALMADSGLVAAHSVRWRTSRSVTDSLASSGGRRSDQGEIWREIDGLHRQLGTSSPTAALRDAYSARGADVERYVAALPPVEGQLGSLVLIDGTVLGLDFVSRPEAYARLHPKLVRSYAMEAIVLRQFGKRPAHRLGQADQATVEPGAVESAAPRPGAAERAGEGRAFAEAEGAAEARRLPASEPPAQAERPDDPNVACLPVARSFLAELAAAPMTEHETPGLGVDVRIRGDRVFGSALVYEQEVIHLSAFPAMLPA